MPRGRYPERRRERRQAFRAKFRGRKLSPLGVELRGIIRGEIHDFSAGGLSLLTRQRLEESIFLRCELLFPNVPVGIPTLVQVKCVRREPKASWYRVGLRFVL